MNDNTPILTVSQITSSIKYCLESTFPLVCIKGEVSNFKRQSSGHLYFSLKDADAQISAVMFRSAAAALLRAPKDGDQVIVKGQINVYPPSGRYQINVRELSLAGIGELLQRLEDLKIKLKNLGYFNKGRKRPLPLSPKSIGIITSPTGAALRDMLNVLSRRHMGFHVILNPVKVQGEGAAKEIARAIEQFNETKLVDVIIVGRGGGSIEDLWAFNEKIVADAIFQSQIPIIGAVGHETDHCIAEYVADARAPTPSAAAEIVLKETADLLEKLHTYRRSFLQTVRQKRASFTRQLAALMRHPIFSSPSHLLGTPMQRLDMVRDQVDDAALSHIKTESLKLQGKRRELRSLNPFNQIRQLRQKMQKINQSLTLLMQAELLRSSRKFTSLKAHLDSINPKNLLGKGYAILFSEKDHSVITSMQSVERGDRIKMLISDGMLYANIVERKAYDRHEKARSGTN